MDIGVIHRNIGYETELIPKIGHNRFVTHIRYKNPNPVADPSELQHPLNR